MISAIPRSDAQEDEALALDNPSVLLATLKQLRQSIYEEGQTTLEKWQSRIQQPEFLSSARNLAYYLALRHRDLRPLQALTFHGIFLLGRDR